MKYNKDNMNDLCASSYLIPKCPKDRLYSYFYFLEHKSTHSTFLLLNSLGFLFSGDRLFWELTSKTIFLSLKKIITP